MGVGVKGESCNLAICSKEEQRQHGSPYQKDVVLLAVSFYLLRQYLARAAHTAKYANVDLISEEMPSDVLACKVPEGAGTSSR
jgi:hypothetical protein